MMTSPSPAPAPKSGSNPIFNLPNQLTMLRLVLAVVMFVFMELEFYWTSLVLFILAAISDWFDGYFARKYGMVTKLGRILDPFADKVIICGAFIFLTTIPALLEVPWGLRPWMVAVIVCRELLVTSLRGIMEGAGSDFSAKWSGKWKMAVQCFAAIACLLYLAVPEASPAVLDSIRFSMIATLWISIFLTLYSGWIYIISAMRMLRS